MPLQKSFRFADSCGLSPQPISDSLLRLVHIHRHELISTTTLVVFRSGRYRRHRHRSPDAPQQQQGAQQDPGSGEYHDVAHTNTSSNQSASFAGYPKIRTNRMGTGIGRNTLISPMIWIRGVHHTERCDRGGGSKSIHGESVKGRAQADWSIQRTH